MIKEEGKSSCGAYRRHVADKLWKPPDNASMKQAIRFGSKPGNPRGTTNFRSRCKLCGDLYGREHVSVAEGRDDADSATTAWARSCSSLPKRHASKQFDYACEALAGISPAFRGIRLVATSRQFPGHMRADVQAGHRQTVLGSPLAVFRHLRTASLRDVDLRGTDPGWPRRPRDRAGAVSRGRYRRERAGEMPR